jgi:hypothetical protein
VAEFDPKGPGRFSSIPRLCLSMLQWVEYFIISENMLDLADNDTF